MKRTTSLISVAVLAMGLGAACDDDERATGGPSRTAARTVVDEPGGTAHADPSVGAHAGQDPVGQAHGGGQPTPQAQAGTPVVGTVAETMNAGGYTYMRLDTPTGPMWIASMEMPVAVGNRVEAYGSVMRGFHSNTLDRTFDQIIFAGSARVLDGAGAAPPPAHGAAPAPAHGAAPALPPGHP